MRCPRCRSECDTTAVRCGRCGAPVRLAEEPAPARLDRPIEIDRRAHGASTARAEPEPGPLLVAGRSGWELGVLAAAAAEPGGAPVVPTQSTGLEPPPLPAPRVVPPTPSTRAPAVFPVPIVASLAPASAASAAPETPWAAARVEVHVRRAPGWRRVLAWMADSIVVAVFAAPIFWLALGPAPLPPQRTAELDGLLEIASRNERLLVSLGAFTLVLALVYATVAHALMGATFGKRALGLRVIVRDGRGPSLARSATRSLLAVVSAAALGLGFLLVLFSRTGRALHDIASGTYVVRTP